MPRSTKAADEGKAFRERVSGRKERSADFGEAQFVRLELSDDQKRKCRLWASAEDFDAWDGVQVLVNAGYRVSIKHDDYNNCEAVFLSTSEPESPNVGLILTGRGGRVYSAVVELLFKHTVMTDGNWPDPSSPAGFIGWEDME